MQLILSCGDFKKVKIMMLNDKPTQMLFSKKIITLPLVFLLLWMLAPSQVWAQKIVRNIKWNKNSNTYILTDGSKLLNPTFEKALTNEEAGYLPVYHENLRLDYFGNVTVTIENPVFSSISGVSDKKNLIQEQIKLNTTEITTRKNPFVNISFIPIRKNSFSGQLEKLESFELKVVVTPRNAPRANRAYAANSVLSNGNWYKVAISNDGVYKINQDFLKKTLGINLDNVSLSSIGIFGYGGGMIPELNADNRFDDLPENSIRVFDNNNNNRFDADDYILFYAQGPDQWKYTSGSFTHVKNLYSDKSYYFITTDKGTGKQIVTTPSDPSPNKTITDFDDYIAHESDEFNLGASGRFWLGDKLSTIKTNTSFSFNFPNLITSSPIKFNTRVAGNSSYSSSFVINANGQQIATVSTPYNISSDPYHDSYGASSKSVNFTSNSDQINLDFNFNSPDPNGNSYGYIDYFEMNAKRALSFTGNAMPFRNATSAGAGNISQFNLSNANGNIQIWDITDAQNAKQIASSLSGSTLSFATATNTLREFVAVDVYGGFPLPEKIGNVENQNLHAIGQPTNIIVTSDELYSAANDLAAFHISKDNMSTKVVRLSQIYNEFGSGKLDISAIRDFVKMVYDNAGNDSTKMPRYLCLFGDASYDPKDRMPDNNNQVPTYESYESIYPLGTFNSDDFFGCLDNTEGGDINSAQTVDIGIGRLPVANATEAQDMVNKIKLYKSLGALGNWRNIITTIGDDGTNGGIIFQNQADKLGEQVRLNYPAYNIEKIYPDAYQMIPTPGGNRYPDVNAAILNRINSGSLVITYTGHGGVNNLSNARIFNVSDIQNLQNKEKMALFVTATCDFSKFDDPEKKSAGEFLINNGSGGAIGMFTTVRPVFSDGNDDIQNSIFDNLFKLIGGRKPTMGELLSNSKNEILFPPFFSSPNNARKFVLLGDPALKLNYPEYNVVTTMVDSVPITQPHDTLKALKLVTISGQVKDEAGNKLTSFNGVCYPLVYDKLATFTTLGNIPEIQPATYNTYKNILFKGTCTVSNGDFSFSFIVPKDINYQIGNGRISYYAQSDANNTDAHGYQNDIMIGGSADSFALDNDGPQIKLFMNDEKFVFGGITNESPKLLAKLEDKSGINTTGNGLGHDLTAILDVNTKNPIVLNQFYESELNNFRKGKVTYPFSKLTEGRHTLRVKAWDIHNNSAEDNTEFVVASSAKLALKHVLNYPNPFTTNTSFMFEHNRPGDQLTVVLQIFTVSGKLIKTIQENVVSTGYRIDDIKWNGLDEYGDQIGKGVYVYKLQVHDSQGNSANKFEKLVLLR